MKNALKLNAVLVTLIATMSFAQASSGKSPEAHCESGEHCCMHKGPHQMKSDKKASNNAESDWKNNRPMVGEKRAL